MSWSALNQALFIICSPTGSGTMSESGTRPTRPSQYTDPQILPSISASCSEQLVRTCTNSASCGSFPKAPASKEDRSAAWALFLDGVPACPTDGDGRVTICHIPPGNSDNAHTITVGVGAVPAHLAHGDFCGACEDDGGLFTDAGQDKGDAVLDALPCPADFDADGDVDAADLADLLVAWGPNPGHLADFDGDGDVDAADLAQVLVTWGSCP